MTIIILVVEDSPEILTNIKLLLQFHDYEVWTARNGVEALELLGKQETPPDLIISDIIMPQMNGYDLLQKMAENPAWNHIPFIFVSARTSPEDVRFGKRLGADDYITKPFDEKDLLASIEGKLARSQRRKINSKLIEENLLTSLKIESHEWGSEEGKYQTCLLYVLWDETYGPRIEACYPPDTTLTVPLEDVGIQLFQTTVTIYGHQTISDGQGVLVKIANLHKDGYLYFDAAEETTGQRGKRPFLLAYLAPSLNYLDSLRIEEIFVKLATRLKTTESWEIKDYWQKITDLLMTPRIDPSDFTDHD